MHKVAEVPLKFQCQRKSLVGILHLPEKAAKSGVLIVVGGPQYRVGSHRQFVLLARFLAGHGAAVMRFDYRGMGDSDGDARSFEDIYQDISAAIDVFMENTPGLEQVVLWGLCDAASAIIFYAAQDSRVGGLVLLNPWVRTEAGEAQAYVKSYYLNRLLSRSFWEKVLKGDFNLVESIKSLVLMILKVFLKKSSDSEQPVENCALPLPERMLAGIKVFKGDVLFVLSGNDLVAEEFKSVVRSSSGWIAVNQRPNVAWRELKEANHTFSSCEWRNQVANWTLEWLHNR